MEPEKRSFKEQRVREITLAYYSMPEVRKAMEGVWAFLKYIEAEYERIVGEPVGIECNDDELLEVANRIWDGCDGS